MGILEQILEANKALSKQLTSLSSEVTLVKETINKYKSSDKLKLEFSDEDILNASITARVLGIKQTELDEIIQKGLLHSVGERKRIFLAKDIAEYLKNMEIQTEGYNDKPRIKKKKKSKIPSKHALSQEQVAELIKMNS